MDYYLHLATLISIYSILALTSNMIIGYLGILFLAGPAIYGIGAYTFSIMSINVGMSFFPAMLAAGVVSMIGGMILAVPSFKLRSHYIGIATLAFLFIFNGLSFNLRELTRGALGIPGIPRPVIFGEYLGTNLGFFLFALACTVIVMAILHRVLHSPYAKVIETIREDETASKTLGKNVIKYKLQIFALSSFFAGIGGSLLASYLGFIHPSSFNLVELTFILSMVVIGGMGSFWGSIVGAALLTLVPEPLRYLNFSEEVIGGLRYGSYGLLLILFMLYRPYGILGKRTNTFNK